MPSSQVVLISSGATAVLVCTHQDLAVQFLLLLFECLFYFAAFQPAVPTDIEKEPRCTKSYIIN